jgi:hypothetical protein
MLWDCSHGAPGGGDELWVTRSTDAEVSLSLTHLVSNQAGRTSTLY